MLPVRYFASDSGLHGSDELLFLAAAGAKSPILMSRFTHISLENKLISIFPILGRWKDRRILAHRLDKWCRDGWSLPLPCVLKRAIIKAKARKMGAEIFVETGTYRGDTVWFFRNDFRSIFTIEVQPNLARLAAERFAGYPHITVVEGDSADKLAEVIPRITGPCLFWLDGHYSAGITGKGASDCPIWGELDAILGHLGHPFGLLIDDARCFDGTGGYPPIDELRKHLAERLPGHGWAVENDIIRVMPAASAK